MSRPKLTPPPDRVKTAPGLPSGATALRTLAGAFAHLRDFDALVHGLQAALDRAGWFNRATLEAGPTPDAGPAQYSLGDLVLPVQGAAGVHGVLRVPERKDALAFGPEDLHLLAALADFLAVVLDSSRGWRELERQRQLLNLLLNQAPVGILAFDAAHRVEAANDLARRWLGGSGDLWGALRTALRVENGAANLPPRTSFHLRLLGRLVFGEWRTAGPGLESEGVTVVVMTDLSPEQARLFDALRRETYRCQWRSLRLCFVLLESAGVPGRLLRDLPALRAEFSEPAAAGPYDANRVGLVLPETGRTAATARLRRLRSVRGLEDLRAGLAELGRDGGEPEALLQSALAHLRPLAEVVRPVLLLHDDSPEVNEALAFVLGRDFEVVTSSNLELTRRLLQTRAFDAIVTEIDLRSASGLELARIAAGAQPGIRPFFTTVSEMPAEAKADPALADAVVFQKPFDVRALARTVREKLQMAGDPSV